MAKSNPPKRPGLKVIGAGLPRTSTSSLQTALQILGYTPCYHTITDFLPHARTHGPLWLSAMNEPDKARRQKILAKILEGYEAIVDGPGCFFVSDWIEMFPEAKVVLGMRTSPEAWLTSVEGSIAKVFGHPPAYYLCYLVPEMHFGFLMNNLWDEQAVEKYGVGVRSTEYYLKRNEDIRRTVPKGRLLEFKAADGWAPLCGFLGKDIPRGKEGESFPHRNDAKAANQLIGSLLVWGVGVWVVIGASGFGIALGVRKWLNM